MAPANRLSPISSRSSLHANRQVTAAALRALSKASELAKRAPELEALAEGIAEGGEAESGWRGANLIESFLPDRTISQPVESVGSHLLGTLAAVVVFFPIAWTWFGLQAALEQYQAVAGAGSTETRSFLQLWTQGFDGAIASYHALPEVALGSVLLITVSIVLVFLDRMQQARRTARFESRWAMLAAELSAVMLAAEQTLRLGSTDTLDDQAALLQDAAKSILDAHQSIAALSSDLNELSTKLRADVSEASISLRDSVASAAKELESAAASAGTSFRDTAADGAASLSKATADTLSDLTASVASIAHAAKSQADAADMSTMASDALAIAADAITKNSQTLSTSIAGIKTGLESAIRPVLVSLDDRVVDLNGHSTSIEDALSSHASALQHQISELTQIRAELTRLGSARDHTTALAPVAQHG